MTYFESLPVFLGEGPAFTSLEEDVYDSGIVEPNVEARGEILIIECSCHSGEGDGDSVDAFSNIHIFAKARRKDGVEVPEFAGEIDKFVVVKLDFVLLSVIGCFARSGKVHCLGFGL